MSDQLLYIAENFKGKFILEPFTMQQRLRKIKAYIFDWDGVFNGGQKDEHGTSPFNEIDSMGTNLLRFNHYLRTGINPFIFIISGENNSAALALGTREHYHAVYSGIKHKMDAMKHLCKEHNIKEHEIAFVFDDVLDFSLAANAGFRVMVKRNCNPLMIDFAIQQNLVDYLTANDGNNNAVREAVEMMMGINGIYKETFENRMNFSVSYQNYLIQRQQIETKFYTSKNSEIVE